MTPWLTYDEGWRTEEHAYFCCDSGLMPWRRAGAKIDDGRIRLIFYLRRPPHVPVIRGRFGIDRDDCEISDDVTQWGKEFGLEVGRKVWWSIEVEKQS